MYCIHVPLATSIIFSTNVRVNMVPEAPFLSHFLPGRSTNNWQRWCASKWEWRSPAPANCWCSFAKLALELNRCQLFVVLWTLACTPLHHTLWSESVSIAYLSYESLFQSTWHNFQLQSTDLCLSHSRQFVLLYSWMIKIKNIYSIYLLERTDCPVS